MNEFLPQDNIESEKGEPRLDRVEIVNRMRELKIDIELEDFEGLDDNDVLGVIGTYAIQYDFDIEEVLRYTVPLESWED